MDKSMLSKLPKWAQSEITRLTRERDAAVKTLNDFVDSQAESKIWTEDNTCSGEEKGPSTKRHYIHSNWVTFNLGDKREIDVGFRSSEPGMLELRSTFGTLVIYPSVSNTVKISSQKF